MSFWLKIIEIWVIFTFSQKINPLVLHEVVTKRTHPQRWKPLAITRKSDILIDRHWEKGLYY